MHRTFLLLAAAAALLSAGRADAHARLIRATPRVGETVARSPPELRLFFSESIDLPASSLTVTGPDGRPVATGRLLLDAQDKRVVIAPLPAPLAPGRYKVVWSMTSVDTHRTDGDYGFKVGP